MFGFHFRCSGRDSVFHTGLNMSWQKVGPGTLDLAWNTEPSLQQHMLREEPLLITSVSSDANGYDTVASELKQNRLRPETLRASPGPSDHLQAMTEHLTAPWLCFSCLLPEYLVYVNPDRRHEGLSKNQKWHKDLSSSNLHSKRHGSDVERTKTVWGMKDSLVQ